MGLIGKVAFSMGWNRMLSPTVHGTDLTKLSDFALALQQDFTVATIPFCEISDRANIEGTPPLVEGHGFYSKVVITFSLDGIRYGYGIYAPRKDMLEPIKVPGRSKKYKDRVKQEWLDRFEEIYPSNSPISVETGWRKT